MSVFVLIVEGVDIEAAFDAAAEVMGDVPKPPLITVGVVSGLAVPGALVEVAAIAAVER